MENRKNTILLTVIAVATLLVAVVGATFAYFTAQGGNQASANVTVQTATADSSSFGTWTAINITADQETFAKGAGDRPGSSTGSVTFTANSQADASFCYTVKLATTSNDFEYTMPADSAAWDTAVAAGKAEGTFNEANKPELLFSATKNSVAVIENMDITTLTADVNIPTVKDGSVYTHRIDATKGATETDSWELSVVLKNRDWDQQNNTGKSFSGAVKFDKVDCPAA